MSSRLKQEHFIAKYTTIISLREFFRLPDGRKINVRISFKKLSTNTSTTKKKKIGKNFPKPVPRTF
jgi:hypothetical protein